MITLREAFLKVIKNMHDLDLEAESKRLDFTNDPLPTSKETQLWVVTVAAERRLRADRNSANHLNPKVINFPKKHNTVPQTVVLFGEAN